MFAACFLVLAASVQTLPASPDTRWEADLQKLGAGRIHTINEGVGGRTLAQDVVQRHPEADTVIVFLGVNDLKNNRTDGADKGAIALARRNVAQPDPRSKELERRIVLSQYLPPISANAAIREELDRFCV